jgi:hypothetical protein
MVENQLVEELLQENSVKYGNPGAAAVVHM